MAITDRELIELEQVLTGVLGQAQGVALLQEMLDSGVRDMAGSHHHFETLDVPEATSSARNAWWSSTRVPGKYRRLLDAKLDPKEWDLQNGEPAVDMSQVFMQWNEELGRFTKGDNRVKDRIFQHYPVFARLWDTALARIALHDANTGKRCHLPVTLPNDAKGVYWLSVQAGCEYGTNHKITRMLCGLHGAMAPQANPFKAGDPDWYQQVDNAKSDPNLVRALYGDLEPLADKPPMWSRKGAESATMWPTRRNKGMDEQTFRRLYEGSWESGGGNGSG